MAKCGAKTQAGGSCQRSAMANGRCMKHGGKTPSGANLPQFKHGRYSKHLPSRLLAEYQASQNDPDLLSLTPEINVVDTRLKELFTKLETGETGSKWADLSARILELEEAVLEGKEAVSLDILHEMRMIIADGSRDFDIWRNIGKNLHDRRIMVESERKRTLEQSQMISAQQVLILIGLIEQTIKKYVSDMKILNSISLEIGQLISSGSPGQIEGEWTVGKGE